MTHVPSHLISATTPSTKDESYDLKRFFAKERKSLSGIQAR